MMRFFTQGDLIQLLNELKRRNRKPGIMKRFKSIETRRMPWMTC